MGLAEHLEARVKSDVLVALGPDPTGELHTIDLAGLVLVWANWRERFISATPRRVHLSRELLSSSEYIRYAAEITSIVTTFEHGGDVTPHLSERVTRVYESRAQRSLKNQRRGDLDLLLSEWGVHHLHLSLLPRPGSAFLTRTRDLLFVIVRPEDVYLLTVLPHEQWTNIKMVEVAVRNWPEAELFHPVRGAIGLSQTIAEEDRPALRNAGVTVGLEVDGQVFFASGQSLAGTPVKATMLSNRVMWQLRKFRALEEEGPGAVRQQAQECGVRFEDDATWQTARIGDWFGILDASTSSFLGFVEVPGLPAAMSV